MAQAERRLDKSKLDSYFLQYAQDVTSQGGEDGILKELFRLLSASPTFNKYCIDIGAWDGKHLSNTYSLLQEEGWAGLLIEAEETRCQDLQALYAHRSDILCLQHLVSLTGDHSLTCILEAHGATVEAGFLCIDIDGADYHLWKSVGETCKAVVVCIEFNPTIPNDVYYIQAPHIEVQQGSSLLAIKELGQELGYTLVVTTTFNAIFVRNDYCQYLPMEYVHQDIDKLHIPYMTTEVFQTYDGELKYVGMKKLLWHKLAINPQKLQILSKKDRKYPFAPTTEASYQKNLDEIVGNFNKAIAEGKFAKESFVDLLALMHLPVIEGTAIELLHQLTVHQVNLWHAHLITNEGMELVDMYMKHATGILETNTLQSVSFLLMAKYCLVHLLLTNPSLDDAKIMQVRVSIVAAKAYRILGEYFMGWNEILSASKLLRCLPNGFQQVELSAAYQKEWSKYKHVIKLDQRYQVQENFMWPTIDHTNIDSKGDSTKRSDDISWKWLLVGMSIGCVASYFVFRRR